MSLTTTNNAALSAMVQDALHYATASRAESTRRQYASNWTQFLTYCAKHGFQALPTDARVVTVYLASLATIGKAVSTIASHLAAIKYFHSEARHSLNWEDPDLQRVVAGIRREAARPADRSAAILPEDLRKLCNGASVRDKAIFLLGFAGAFRRSEISALNVEDIEFVPEGAIINVRKSKTDQESNGAQVAIPFAADSSICPVLAVKAWLEQARISSGPVFRSVNKIGTVGASGLSDEGIRLILAKAVDRAGLGGKLTPHSLRAGFCTAAAISGKSLDRIATHARHNSIQTTMGYVRVANQFRDNAVSGVL